jgi:serine/threonine-protein kinase HipA
MARLWVWIPPLLIGVLDQDGDAGGFSFQYDPAWLAAQEESAFALSLSLKLEEGVYRKEATAFFTNLLPEGSARESLCRKMGISVENDFELLRRIGRDCAGALVLTEEDRPPAEPPTLEELPLSSLEKWLKNGSSGLLDLQIQGDLRLSLAGAQDKLPLVYLNGKFYQPRGSHPTTHILKPPPQRFKNLPENEWIQGRLARALGLPVSHATLVEIGGKRSLLVERYDRRLHADQWSRLHQEDLCQALGISPRKKYQGEGGPSVADCQGVIDRRSADPLTDTDTLLRWQIFNVLIGNCDAHGKNLSLLRHPDKSWRIAPLYDLVATRIYPELSDRLAMAVAGQFNSGTVHANHWRALFKECQVSPAVYLKEANRMASLLPEKLDAVLGEFEHEFGKLGWLAVLRKHLLQRQKSFLELMSPGERALGG